MTRIFVMLLLLAFSTPAMATIFMARVERVKDGDSLVVWRPDVKRRSEIRLAGIDAPELAQPWGIQSRSALRRMIEGREVKIQVTDRDRYGRLVARMWVRKAYVNADMVRAGDAWAFDRYLKDKDIRAGQTEARAKKRGLWTLKPQDRVPPATWRAKHPRYGGGR